LETGLEQVGKQAEKQFSGTKSDLLDLPDASQCLPFFITDNLSEIISH